MYRRIGNCVTVTWSHRCILSEAKNDFKIQVLLAHANGFCKEIWSPVFDEFVKIIQSSNLTSNSVVLPPPPPFLHFLSPSSLIQKSSATTLVAQTTTTTTTSTTTTTPTTTTTSTIPTTTFPPKTKNKRNWIKTLDQKNQKNQKIGTLSFDFISIDLGGHGDSQICCGNTLDSWDSDWVKFGDDICSVALTLNGGGVSLGATGMIFANHKMPHFFDHLILIEPIMRKVASSASKFPLGERALQRRSIFKNKEEVMKIYKEKPLFRDWDPRALSLYISHAFFTNLSLQYELKCPPTSEAKIFSSAGKNRVFSLTESISCPISLVFGGESYRNPVWDDFRALVKHDIETYELKGVRHLVPMIDPKTTAFLFWKVVLDRLAPNKTTAKL